MLLFNFLGLFEVFFLGFYHDKSPLFHFQVAVGEDFLFFPSTKQANPDFGRINVLGD